MTSGWHTPNTIIAEGFGRINVGIMVREQRVQQELQRIRRRQQAAKSRRRPSPDSDVISDLSCIYRGGLISTLFPCSHTGRCEAGPGGKRVALSRPGRWAPESCASANPEEGPTSHGHWEKHRHHLFYIKSVRLNKEANNLQLSGSRFSQIWSSAFLIMFVQNCFYT